ncbi:ester cyclase [Lentzea sp. NPDC059081]|uniref:ester cyclase n=1 Tax=Lentzea sp. NPDC059081 TaxID=3346719 RepID=UPI00369C6594
MSTQENIDVVRGYIDVVFNGGDLGAIDRYWAEDMIWRGGTLGEYQGIDAYRAYLEATAAAGAFAGMRLDVRQVVAVDDDVVISFTLNATHTGPFLGAPATGRQISGVPGIAIFRVADGRIAEATFVEDLLGLAFQLGVTRLPSPPRG